MIFIDKLAPLPLWGASGFRMGLWIRTLLRAVTNRQTQILWMSTTLTWKSCNFVRRIAIHQNSHAQRPFANASILEKSRGLGDFRGGLETK